MERAADKARLAVAGLGRMGAVHARMAPPRPEFLAGSGGIFVDMGIHDFDAARWLVGEVASVSAHGTVLSGPGFASIGDYDMAVAVLTFESGALGVLDISRVSGYGYESSAELLGSGATVRIEEPFLHGYEWRTAGSVSRPLVQTFDRRYVGAFATELEQFACSIVEDKPTLVTGADALAAFDLALAADQSCRLGRPVNVSAPAGRTEAGRTQAGRTEDGRTEDGRTLAGPNGASTVTSAATSASRPGA